MGNVTINKTTVFNGGGYLPSLGRCRGFMPYYPPIFGGGCGGYCCNPLSSLAVAGGIAIGMNFPAVCNGVWSGVKAVGKGIGNFFGWVFRGFKKKPKAVEEDQKPNTDNNTQKT